MSLIAELKRRNVFRVGAAYGIVAWLLVEMASVVLPALRLPEWTLTLLVFLVVAGFPLALILAWAFELTPEGIKLDSAADSTAPVTRKARSKLDFAIVGLLVLAVVYIAVDKFVLEAELEPVEVEKSIAVLPFVNMSPDSDNEFFSDGIAEELLNVLARIPELKVAARTSSFQFKGQNRDIAEIGRALKVSNVLEGSVRKAGSRVRITAQLIKVDDGFHLWSDTFDRELTDIFAIQDEIAAAIANAMKTTLNLSTGGADNLTGTNSLQAYELYLQGMQNWHLRELSTVRKAEDLFLRAIEIDPGFAKAHAGLALVYTVTSFYSGEPDALYRPKVNQAARRALAIDPRNAEALAALGATELDLAKGASLLEQAITINPSFATAYQWYGDTVAIAGDLEEGRRQFERAYELDPRSRIIGYGLALMNMYLGRMDEALRLVEQMKTFALDWNENLELEFVMLLTTGQLVSAEAVGKRLAEVLNKETPNVGPYLDLFGETPQREAAAEELLSWPRDSRMSPDSPAILHDFDLFYVMAAAGQTEPALSLMTHVAERNPRFFYLNRFAHSLSSFNCNLDAQAIYASLPFASPQHDDACPISGNELP